MRGCMRGILFAFSWGGRESVALGRRLTFIPRDFGTEQQSVATALDLPFTTRTFLGAVTWTARTEWLPAYACPALAGKWPSRTV